MAVEIIFGVLGSWVILIGLQVVEIGGFCHLWEWVALVVGCGCSWLWSFCWVVVVNDGVAGLIFTVGC